MANTILSTLYSITTTKEEELAKHRDACRALKAELLEPLNKETDSRLRVQSLLKDAGQRIDSRGKGSSSRRRRKDLEQKVESRQHQELLKLAGISPANLQRFIEQSSSDASISAPVFNAWEDKLKGALDAQQIKYEYATLFSSLVNERAAEGNDAETPEPGPGSDSPSFESVGRPEMHQQRREWESLVFEANDIDPELVTAALDTAFSLPEARFELHLFRAAMEKFSHRLANNMKVTVDVVKQCISGLLSSDLLSDDQASVLRTMSENTTYLGEMADVLNLRVSSIDNWKWPGPIECEMRRQLNGKYRVYMQEEITQALLLYYIGAQWAMKFRGEAHRFRAQAGWKNHSSVTSQDQAVWKYYVGPSRRIGFERSIETQRRDDFGNSYFMSMLPDELGSTMGYGSDDTDAGAKMNGFELKQSVLHLLTAESVMAYGMKEDMCVLQTDFRWFGPSISHSALLATLRFFGIDKRWLGFFHKFLGAPLRFVHDGLDGPVRTRKRGTPMSHVLSDFFNETMLFALDFSVNQATGGKPMYRLHDDIFFFGSGEECISAWNALTELARSLGIEINHDKTGAGKIVPLSDADHHHVPKALPSGPLKWGFLRISGAGQWTIDQDLVDANIVEMRRQLAATRSVFSWIKAYNTYVRFFIGSFCAPANCLGTRHLDDCLSTLRKVHLALFPDTNGDVGAYLKHRIASKFEIKAESIPDGFIYFPWSLGGLEVLNPFISLQSMRINVENDPYELMGEALEDEEAQYNNHRDRFEKEGPADRHALKPQPKEFMTREQYAKYRRVDNSTFYETWLSLREKAEEESVEPTAEINQLLSKMPDAKAKDGITREWADMNPYWKAVVELYGNQMGRMFGGLAVVEKGLLPLGMLTLFKGKTRWQG